MYKYTIETQFREYPHGGLRVASRSVIVQIILWVILVPILVTILALGGFWIFDALQSSSPGAQALPIGIALFILSIPLIATPHPYPRRIVFDADARKMYLLDHDDTPLDQAPHLSYDAIHYLKIKRHVTRSDKSQRVSYQVELIKKDLTTWKLFHHLNASKAESLREDLIKVMRWTQPDDFSLPDPDEDQDTASRSDEDSAGYSWSLSKSALGDDTPSPPFKIERGVDQAEIRWTPPKTMRRDLGIKFFTLSMILICVGGVLYGGFGWIGTLISGLILRLVVKNKAAGDEEWVKITSDQVITQKSASLLGSLDEVSINNDDVIGVGFDLENPTQLKIITHELYELQKMIAHKENLELRDLLKIVSLAKSAIAINSIYLSPSQVLELEVLIEREFKRVTGRELR